MRTATTLVAAAAALLILGSATALAGDAQPAPLTKTAEVRACLLDLGWIQKGDLLVSVNGVAADSERDAPMLCEAVKDTLKFILEIHRPEKGRLVINAELKAEEAPLQRAAAARRAKAGIPLEQVPPMLRQGLKPGDRVLSINDIPASVHNYDQIMAAVQRASKIIVEAQRPDGTRFTTEQEVEVFIPGEGEDPFAPGAPGAGKR